MQTLACEKTVTQFELSNLIRKSKLFSRIKLRPSTRLVLESLVYHYPNIRINSKTLSEETGNCLKSIETSLKELKELNLIVITYTGRSSIFNLTQKFFDLLEVADQIPKKIRTRSANITLPHNKENNKNLNKAFQVFSNKNEPKFLKDEQQCKIILDSYHKHNIKEHHIKTIKLIFEKWDFALKDFPHLKDFI